MSNGSLNGRRRVVITGMGAVSPLANDVETTWQRLLAGDLLVMTPSVRHSVRAVLASTMLLTVALQSDRTGA